MQPQPSLQPMLSLLQSEAELLLLALGWLFLRLLGKAVRLKLAKVELEIENLDLNKNMNKDIKEKENSKSINQRILELREELSILKMGNRTLSSPRGKQDLSKEKGGQNKKWQ